MFILVAQWLPPEPRSLPLRPARVEISEAGVHPDSQGEDNTQTKGAFAAWKEEGMAWIGNRQPRFSFGSAGLEFLSHEASAWSLNQYHRFCDISFSY